MTKPIGLDQFIPVPLAELEKALFINEHALEEACQRQADAFWRVSKQLAYAISERDQAELIVSETEALVEYEFRQAVPSDEKVTNPEVKAAVNLDKRVKHIRREYLRFKKLADDLGALKEAFQQRSYMLREMVKLHLASYYGEIEQREPNNYRGLRNMRAEIARDGMNRQRKERT